VRHGARREAYANEEIEAAPSCDMRNGIKEPMQIAIVCLLAMNFAVARTRRQRRRRFAGVDLPVTLGRRAFAADPSFCRGSKRLPHKSQVWWSEGSFLGTPGAASPVCLSAGERVLVIADGDKPGSLPRQGARTRR
jgi:hypothetical protein